VLLSESYCDFVVQRVEDSETACQAPFSCFLEDPALESRKTLGDCNHAEGPGRADAHTGRGPILQATAIG